MGLKRNHNGKRTLVGMAMVEMIFVLPLLLILVFAIAQFGLMFSRWLTLSNAVREGARVGVAFRVPCNAGTVEDEAQSAASSYAQAGGVGMVADDFTVTGECDGSGTPLEVKGTYFFDIQIPFAGIDSIPLGYSSKMRNE